MHSYLGMVWCAVFFGHQPCGISRTNCQGQSWKNPWWKPSKASILAQLMFAGTIYLLAVTLCSSFVHFGRLAHLPAFQSYRGPLDHSRKWFHWKVSVRLLWAANPVPGLRELRDYCISLSLSVSMNACLAIYTLLGNRLSLLAQCSVLYQLKLMF